MKPINKTCQPQYLTKAAYVKRQNLINAIYKQFYLVTDVLFSICINCVLIDRYLFDSY